MSERIDTLTYETDSTGAQVRQDPFYNGPAEFLVQEVVSELKQISEWTAIFGEFIDFYKRNDYPIRALPALRIYNDISNKQFESWFIEGDLKADIILPASLRRNELQQIQDTLAMALLQQFRRPTFFTKLCERVPGLNELGKAFSSDKSLGFEWGDSWVPLTQITLNFRLDLRVWDEYLEQTDRVKDSPFEKVLGDLRQIVGTIKVIKDDGEPAEIEEGFNVKTGV
jgi:hypothetical protein